MEKKKKQTTIRPVASEANANHVSNVIMGSSSPNNRTIDTKEEKWKLLLGKACHGMLAGRARGLNPAAAGLELGTPRQPTAKEGWLPPSELPAAPPAILPHLSSSPSQNAHSMHRVYLLTHPRVGGLARDEQKKEGTAWRWAWEGETSKVTQQAAALNVLATGTPGAALGSGAASVLFYA